MNVSYNWDDVYPELVNKMRWSLQTAFSMEGFNFPYSTAQRISTVLSQDAVELMKCARSSEDVLSTTDTIRGFYAQTRVDNEMNRT